jgi:hypothetical protein
MLFFEILYFRKPWEFISIAPDFKSFLEVAKEHF